MRASLFAGCIAALVLATGCRDMNAYVDGVMIPDADRVIPAEPGPTVVVKLDTDEKTVEIPKAPVVRLAVERAVSWSRVELLMKRVEQSGARPVLLVGIRDKIHAFRLTEPLSGKPAIQLLATSDGKACVGHPESQEMRCFQGGDRRHVHRAFVRENIREAVKEYELHEVRVRVDPAIEWADAIRAVDGARTCCGDTRVAAALVQ